MTAPAHGGRQAERTVLSYWRTELAAMVVAMLLIREASPGGERAVVAVAVALAVAVTVGASSRRQRRLLAGRTAADPTAVLAIAGTVTVLQVVAITVIL